MLKFIFMMEMLKLIFMTGMLRLNFENPAHILSKLDSYFFSQLFIRSYHCPICISCLWLFNLFIKIQMTKMNMGLFEGALTSFSLFYSLEGPILILELY